MLGNLEPRAILEYQWISNIRILLCILENPDVDISDKKDLEKPLILEWETVIEYL
jgi:hypothetical protein